MASSNEDTRISGRGQRPLGAAAVIALATFAAGVGTTGIVDIGSESLAGFLYFAGGLSVFGGLDLGTPIGGPLPARIALWIAYFMAPAITTTVHGGHRRFRSLLPDHTGIALRHGSNVYTGRWTDINSQRGI